MDTFEWLRLECDENGFESFAVFEVLTHTVVAYFTALLNCTYCLDGNRVGDDIHLTGSASIV